MWAAFPPLLAIWRCLSLSIEANPRLGFSVMMPSSFAQSFAFEATEVPLRVALCWLSPRQVPHGAACAPRSRRAFHPARRIDEKIDWYACFRRLVCAAMTGGAQAFWFRARKARWLLVPVLSIGAIASCHST